MSKIYQLTKQIHDLTQQKAKKYGKELEITVEYYINPQGSKYHIIEIDLGHSEELQDALETLQLRQILIALQDQLGIKVDSFERRNLSFTHNENGKLQLPLIDREPENVLTELVKLLEKL